MLYFAMKENQNRVMRPVTSCVTHMTNSKSYNFGLHTI